MIQFTKIVLSLLFVSITVLVGCGKATRVESRKSPSQFQGKTSATDKSSNDVETKRVGEKNEDKITLEKKDPVEAILDSTTREKVKSALAKVDVKSFLLSTMLSKEVWSKAQKFSFDMIKCGVSYAGPRCAENLRVTNTESMSLYRYKDRSYYYVEFKPNEEDQPMAFLFHLDKTEPDVTVSKIQVFSLHLARTANIEIPAYLRDPASATLLTELGLTKTTFSENGLDQTDRPQ